MAGGGESGLDRTMAVVKARNDGEAREGFNRRLLQRWQIIVAVNWIRSWVLVNPERLILKVLGRTSGRELELFC